MNIFYLHWNPFTCATMHNDKHCVKMILETAQILSTVHHHYDTAISRYSDIYKPTHKHHPSTKWAMQTDRNYKWLWELLYWLCKEYTYRYGKIHKVERSGLLDTLHLVPCTIPIGLFTDPPQAMPDECKIVDNSIEAYRKYYMQYKNHISKWTNRDIPEWFIAA